MSKDYAYLLANFKKYLIKQDLSERTIKGYMGDLCFFSNWYQDIQGKKIAWLAITFFDLQTFRQYLIHGKRQKFSAVNRRLQALKRFFDWAEAYSFIKKENPTEHLRFMRRQSTPQPQALTKTEVHHLLRTAGQSFHGLAKRNVSVRLNPPLQRVKH